MPSCRMLRICRRVLPRASISLAGLVPFAARAQTPDPAAILILPHDLSPWGMFLHADIVVRVVMAGLAAASVVSWTVWLGKTVELAALRRQMRRAGAALADAPSLEQGAARLKGSEGAAVLIEAARTELALSDGAAELGGIKDRVALRLERLQARAVRQALRGTGVLASVGATAPFVGLFGTVWGIMNAFIGISRAHTTNLAVVAPGIAEALLATALGLVAAIPAVVMYNILSRAAGAYRELHADAAADVLRLVGRDLDRGLSPADRAASAAAAE